MSNAIGYVLTNFVWFGGLVAGGFSAKLRFTDPFAWWALLGAVGSLTFVIGVILSELRRVRRSYLLLLSLLLAVIMVAFSGAYRGQVHGTLLGIILWGTLGLQAVVAAATLYLARGGRFATILMMPLCTSFCLMSQLDAAMSFQDVWL